MKETDVAYFGTLLNIETGDVEKAVEDGSLSEKVKALNLMGSEQVETLKGNLTKDVKTTYFGELVEQAKKGELDKELYDPIHGAVHEMIEKDLVKTYEVEKGTLKEMIAKISTNGQSNDNEQLQQKITDLQTVNENLVKEKDDAVSEAKTEFTGKILLRDKTDQLNALPFDFSDVEEGKLEEATTTRKGLIRDVFDARFTVAFSDDKLVVKDKDGNIRKNEATLEPLPVLDVMTSLASELGLKMKSPETGGQGGSSSGGNGKAPFKNEAEFNQYCIDNKINPNIEGVAIWKERKPQ